MELSIIKTKIHNIQGNKVILDFDLAELYEVETRVLKQAVRRNLKCFPDDFMFQLTKDEWKEVITNCDNLLENIKFSLVAGILLVKCPHGIKIIDYKENSF